MWLALLISYIRQILTLLLSPADAAKLQHSAKGDSSTKGTEVRKDAEFLVADAGKEVDKFAAQARDGTHKVDQKLEEYRARAEKGLDTTIKQTGTELNKAVDAFDKNVQQVSLKGNMANFGMMLTERRARRRPRPESLAGLVESEGGKSFRAEGESRDSD